MFSYFREDLKAYLKENKIIYQDIAEKAHISVGTLKCFMCGANDSRRTAEKIVDALGLQMSYSDGKYQLTET